MKWLLLDTSVYFAFIRRHRQAGYAIGGADEIYLNVIVMGEIFEAFLRGSKREQNQADFDRFVDSPYINIIAIDEITAERYAYISDTLRRSGTPISLNDTWIAASALQHGLEILTSDSDFMRVPQVVTRLLY